VCCDVFEVNKVIKLTSTFECCSHVHIYAAEYVLQCLVL